MTVSRIMTMMTSYNLGTTCQAGRLMILHQEIVRKAGQLMAEAKLFL